MDSDSKIFILSNHLDFFQEQLIDLKIIVEDMGNKVKNLEESSQNKQSSLSNQQTIFNQQESNDKRNKENMELYNRVLKAEEQNAYFFKMLEQQSNVIKRAEERIRQLESSSNQQSTNGDQIKNNIENKLKDVESQLLRHIQLNNSDNLKDQVKKAEDKINSLEVSFSSKFLELDMKTKSISANQSSVDSSQIKKNEERIISLEFAVDRQKHIINSAEEDKKKVKQLEDAFAYLKKNDRQSVIESKYEEQCKTILSLQDELNKAKSTTDKTMLSIQSVKDYISTQKKSIENLENLTKVVQEEIKSKKDDRKDDYVSALQNKIDKHNMRILSIEDRMKLQICLGNVCSKCNHVYDKIFPCNKCNKKSCYDCVYCKDNGKDTEYYCSSCFSNH